MSRVRLRGSLLLVLGFFVWTASGGAPSGAALAASRPAALSSTGFGAINSVSCAAAGECGVGGSYLTWRKPDGRNILPSFVLGETNGSWGHVLAVRGAAPEVSVGGLSLEEAGVADISCPAPGECTAVGSSKRAQPFVVSETNGHWGRATVIPGLARLYGGGDDFADVGAVSCAAAGECAAAGGYAPHTGGDRVWVASETNGRWNKAIEVPGAAKFSGKSGWVQVEGLSCAAAGECAAVVDVIGDDASSVILATETHGQWGKAIHVPGLAGLGTWAFSISCGAPGDCAAGGYFDRGKHPEAFVVDETNGLWSKAIREPGLATLDAGHDDAIDSISCTGATDCVAGGYYTDGNGKGQAFVVSESNGSWGNAIEVPATESSNNYGVYSVSCAAVGECGATGFYTHGPNDDRPFVVSETNGTWGDAIDVAGAPHGEDGNISISCGAVGECAVGGSLSNRSGHTRAFVIGETNSVWGNAIRIDNFPG